MTCNKLIMIIKSYIRYIFVRIIQIAWKKKKLAPADEVHRILVFQLSMIGDMVLTIPFLRELRRNYVDAEITLIVRPSVYNLIELCPYVDHILTFKRIDGSIGYFLSFFKARKFVEENLLNQVFDLAITPRWHHDSFCHAGIIMYLANTRKRIAYSEHSYPEKEWLDKGYDHFFTDFIPSRCKVLHAVDRALDSLRYLNASIESDELELWTDETDRKYAEQLLVSSVHKRIVIVPSASMPYKEWDIKNFINLIEKINSHNVFDFIVLGGKSNTEHYGNILENQFQNVYNLVGKSTLRQTVEIMKKCDFYIGVDTGPMHIAAAIGLPGIAVFCHPIGGDDAYDPCSPLQFGPWKSCIKIILPIALPGCERRCMKNYAHCINQITTDQVYKEFQKMI